MGPKGRADYWDEEQSYVYVYRRTAQTWPDDGVCRYDVTSVSIMQLCNELAPGMNMPAPPPPPLLGTMMVVVVDAEWWCCWWWWC